MRKEIEDALTLLETKERYLYRNDPPINIADLEAILYVILLVVIEMLKRELKRLA